MSTSQFHVFAARLAEHFKEMSQGELFRVDIDGDKLWELYLAAFPAGTNPLFRVRTEHDGSYDRNFIRQLGNVVRIENNKLVSIWQLNGLPEPYQTVADRMAALIESRQVAGLFRTKESKYGYVRTIENRDGQESIEWFHFNAVIPRHLISGTPDAECGAANSTVAVAARGLVEITPQAVADVLDLIDQGTLYRGDEFKQSLIEFRQAQTLYRVLTGEAQRTILLWSNYKNGALRIRNTAIGTLLTELSEGMDLDNAVIRFERMVAPTNYKRPIALITPRMVENAVSTIQSLNLESALQRRHATLEDISINNVLWADNKAAAHMKDGITEILLKEAKTVSAPVKNAIDIDINDFVNNVLHKAETIDLFLTTPMQANLANITAPVDATAGNLFKWNNNFAWSYKGDVTDSIKERVKAAGGNTNAKLRVSLAWFNGDDLDIHANCPNGHVYYGDKMHILDVDMNAGTATNRIDPVENLSWANPRDGEYRILVHQYNKRSTENVGFVVEIENDGKTTQYNHSKALVANVCVVIFTVKSGKIIKLTVGNPHISQQSISRNVWGVETEQFTRVETVLNSPNFWDGQAIGNKHWFFILENCKNPEPCRGIYNEFLKPELETHRKVFEVLGNKTKVDVADQQLSGVGFSSTKRDSVLLRVTSSNATQIYKVIF